MIKNSNYSSSPTNNNNKFIDYIDSKTIYIYLNYLIHKITLSLFQQKKKKITLSLGQLSLFSEFKVFVEYESSNGGGAVALPFL